MVIIFAFLFLFYFFLIFLDAADRFGLSTKQYAVAEEAAVSCFLMSRCFSPPPHPFSWKGSNNSKQQSKVQKKKK